MKQYLDALKHVLENGIEGDDRTGVGTISTFGYQMRFDLTEGFPAVTTKKLAWRAVVGELLWFLEGSTDERRLAEITFEKDRSELTEKKTIWTANADKQGVELGYENSDTRKELGPVYGYQWRNWEDYNPAMEVLNYHDQISNLINDLINDPGSRRHILSAWNVAQIDKMALPPCHTLAQFYVRDGKLSCQLYQRSADMFLGVPFNIASYSLLVHILAKICDLNVGDFVWTGGDCHIYTNHVEQVLEQVKRVPHELPTLQIPDFKTLDDVLSSRVSDFTLLDYDPMESIKASMAV